MQGRDEKWLSHRITLLHVTEPNGPGSRGEPGDTPLGREGEMYRLGVRPLWTSQALLQLGGHLVPVPKRISDQITVIQKHLEDEHHDYKYESRSRGSSKNQKMTGLSPKIHSQKDSCQFDT